MAREPAPDTGRKNISSATSFGSPTLARIGSTACARYADAPDTRNASTATIIASRYGKTLTVKSTAWRAPPIKPVYGSRLRKNEAIKTMRNNIGIM